jgi:hypothetical protein
MHVHSTIAQYSIDNFLRPPTCLKTNCMLSGKMLKCLRSLYFEAINPIKLIKIYVSIPDNYEIENKIYDTVNSSKIEYKKYRNRYKIDAINTNT